MTFINQPFKYSGAIALILLHEKYLKLFYKTWLVAKKNDVKLPETDDEYYQSLDWLLYHVVRSAGNYMIWICDKLQLPDPGITPAPQADEIEAGAEKQIDLIISKWRIPLANIEEELFHAPVHVSNWGVPYCIDAMLEHAVMHPLRHENQLKRLIKEQKRK